MESPFLPLSDKYIITQLHFIKFHVFQNLIDDISVNLCRIGREKVTKGGQ